MEKKSTLKIPMSQIANINEFRHYQNLLECYLCKNLATAPSYCENCKNSFCKSCLEELNIKDNKCPNCMLENAELSVSNEKFYDFFKDLQIQCYICDEKISYPSAKNHKCFNILIKPSDQKKDDDEEYKIINNVIHSKCQKCKEFIEFSLRDNHLLVCPANNFNVNMSISNPLGLNQVPCKFCLKNINPNDQITHLVECPEYIKKVSIEKLNPSVQNLQNPNPSLNLIEMLDNFNKFTQNLDSANIKLLIATMSSLEKTIFSFQTNLNASYCRSCKTVKQNYELILCKCCNKKYCSNCCTPCTSCDGIISKNCLFACQSCKMMKCPLCEIQSGTYCVCLENKFCKTCFNNPNINNLSIGMLKGPHLNCSFFRLLDNSVYVMKLPKFNFKAEVTLNSIKQAVSLSLIKNGVEVYSRIFQININDKLVFLNDGVQLKIGSSIDFWGVDVKTLEGGLDFIIMNFNLNPNYALILNKLNSTNFDTLNASSTGVVSGMFEPFSIRKNIISHILVEKI